MFGRKNEASDKGAYDNGWVVGRRSLNGIYLKKPPKPKALPLQTWQVTLADGQIATVKGEGYELRRRHATFVRYNRDPTLCLRTADNCSPWLEWVEKSLTETVVAEFWNVLKIERIDG